MEKPTKAVAVISQQIPQIQTPEVLIAQAIDKGVSVETMERLLAMRRELKAEQAKEAFDADMATFQAKCPTIKKTKSVRTKAGIVAYSYAPLESIVEQVKSLLCEHNFSYAVNTETSEGKVKAICAAKHKLGHSESSSIELPFGNKTDIMSQTQVVAAALTFAKRYAFCNVFGILTGDEDNDAVKTETNKAPAKDAFEKAKKIIEASKNPDILIASSEKIKKSGLYSIAEKKVLQGLINAKVDEING